MSSRRRALQGMAVVVATFCGMSGLGGAPASVADPVGKSSDSAISVNSAQTTRELTTYWTPERRRQATPEKPVRADKATTTGMPASRKPAQSAPGTAPTRTLASPSGGVGTNAITRAQLWGSHGQMPATTMGKLFYTRDDGSSGYCSASVINAENLSTIWTAGHCVHGGGAGHDWFSDFLFMPDYDNGNAIGSWSWKTVTTTNGWAQDGDWLYDIAAVVVYPNALGSLADYTGSQGYKFNSGFNWTVNEFGYPEDAVPARNDLNGERLFYCQGGTSEFSGYMEIECDMFHGASGGPWLDDLQLGRGWGYIVGANSWHYFDFSVYRSAYHGDAAVNVFNAVRNA